MNKKILSFCLVSVLLASCAMAHELSGETVGAAVIEVPASAADVEAPIADAAVTQPLPEIPDGVALHCDSNALNVSSLLYDGYHELQFGDGSQFFIPEAQEMIFTMINGSFVGIGNGVMHEGEVYLPISLLGAIGMEQELTKNGFGSYTYTMGEFTLRCLDDYFVVENGDLYVEEPYETLIHNDVRYIPAVKILPHLGYTVAYEELTAARRYKTVTISADGREPMMTAGQAQILLTDAIRDAYAALIAQIEADLAKGLWVFTEERFAKMKQESETVTVTHIGDFGDYDVFCLADYGMYSYVNRYTGAVFSSQWVLPELCITQGVPRIGDIYY